MNVVLLLLTSNFSHRIYVLPIAEAVKEGQKKEEHILANCY